MKKVQTRLFRNLIIIMGARLLISRAYAQTTQAEVAIQVYAHLMISGSVGSNYVVQSTGDLQSNQWQPLTNLLLPRSPFEWVDESVAAVGTRFYRVLPGLSVSVTTNAGPYPNGSFTTISASDHMQAGTFQWLHAAPCLYQGGVAGLGSYGEGCANAHGMTFGFYGDDLTLPIRYETWNQQDNSGLRIMVDGEPTLAITNLLGDGSSCYVRLHFPTSAIRQIEVLMQGGVFDGVSFPSNCRFINGSPVSYKRVIFIGDSFTEGANGVSTEDTFPLQTGSFFSNMDAWALGIGQTGYIATGQTTNYQGRVYCDIITNHPDVVVISGGINDGDDSHLYSAANLLFSTIRSNLPLAKIMVVGVFSPRTQVSSNTRAATTQIFRAATDNGCAFIDPAESDAKNWLVPGDVWGTDPTHPHVIGHHHIAEHLAPWIATNCPELVLKNR